MTVDEGSLDEEIIRKLMELRTYLDSKIRQLEDEQDKLKALFKIVDEVIISKSFRIAESARPTRAETVPEVVTHQVIQAPPPRVEASSTAAEEIPMKTQGGLLLANIYISEVEARIVPAEGMAFTENTPPFQSFFVGRILESMKLRDQEDVKSGALPPNEAFEYEVIKQGEEIREIMIRNYRNQKRMREIMTTARWTLEKMNEKAGMPS